MEYHDVVIVGAGIAGAGLAYNLSRQCPDKSVLVIDSEEPGARAAYGCRNTTGEVIEEYNLPYIHRYKGIKIGADDEVYAAIDHPFYFFDYSRACKILLSRSKADFSAEKAVNVKGRTLMTDKARHRFRYLIDCSGARFFLKRLLKKPLPCRYWIGMTKVLENNSKMNNDYFYYQFSDSEYFEDIYFLEDKIIQGDWAYSKKIDFSLINPPEKTLYKKHVPNPSIINEHKAVIPCAHTLPLVHKNYAFLGDSFGNASPASASGIHLTLDSSKILANSIKKENLKLYDKLWKKKYLTVYNKFLANRLDTHHNSRILRKIKNYPKVTEMVKMSNKYPETFLKLLNTDPEFNLPPEMKKKIPKRKILFLLYHYAYVKVKYFLMQFR